MSDAFERLTGLALVHPWMLLLALLVPLALWVRLRRPAPAVTFSPGAFLESPRALLRSWRVALVPLPLVLQALALLGVVVALARPVHREALPLATQGIDILLCVDTSSSMTATDMDDRRTRLEVARDAAARFVAGRPHDRIGLVSFARWPDLRCPPTLDHRALRALLAEVTTVPSDSPEDATGIGNAVARAAQALRTSAAPSKVVILLTDGEENVATAQTPGEIAPIHAAQLCAELGIRVYTIVAGVGRRTPSGEWVALDTHQVERLAERTGGAFHTAPDADAVARVYAAIDAMEKAELPKPRWRALDRFLPLLGVAVALLVGARLLESSVLAVLP